ncbi:MAG: redoxin domain-containing protein [Actinomycetota bacterium]
MRRGAAMFLAGAAVVMLLATACGGGTGPGKATGETGPVGVGSAAADFTLPSAQGGEVSLADFRGHQPVLLYFSMGPG